MPDHDPNDWIRKRMESEFGKENVLTQTKDSGYTKIIGSTNGKTGNEYRRDGFLIREIRCTHDFKNVGDPGYMTECEDNPEMHERFDINDFKDKEGVLENKIKEMKDHLFA